MKRRFWIMIPGLLLAGSLVLASHYIPRDTRTPGAEGMVWIPPGTFSMGCGDCELPDAVPVHRVRLDGFWMDATPATNADFELFIEETGYLTVAERPLNPADYPGVPIERLVPGSAVFQPSAESVRKHGNHRDWWKYLAGANWKHPEGPGSDLHQRHDHPVVHIAYPDAVAYCAWAGKRLPTEAEYEYAARGGLHGRLYSWGDELTPAGRWAANIWQGEFPNHNTAQDGYTGTSPVKAFPANGYGLYDVSGNVWQWVSDWYRADTYQRVAEEGPVADNPQGPDGSDDPQEPGIPKKGLRGGSFLCSAQYCTRYLVGSRGRGSLDSSASNIGIRCVK